MGIRVKVVLNVKVGLFLVATKNGQTIRRSVARSIGPLLITRSTRLTVVGLVSVNKPFLFDLFILFTDCQHLLRLHLLSCLMRKVS